MPNFEAQVRTSYRDVAGLVLSCGRQDVVEDPVNPGFVREWINRAPGLPSKPRIRQPGDPASTYTGARFTNPLQVDQALQPALAGQRVQFDRARSTYLVCSMEGDAPENLGPLSAGYQFERGADSSDNQAIFASQPSEFHIYRLNGSGNAQMFVNGFTTSVGGDHAEGTFLVGPDAAGDAPWEQDGGLYSPGLNAGVAAQIVDGSLFYIGADSALNHLDGTLDSIHVWAAELSPKTRDLIWQTLDQDGNDYSADLRAPMTVPIWTDLTGEVGIDQFDRLRPQPGFPHRYVKVTLPSSPALHRVQVAAAVNGVVLPDSQLGGDLFTHRWVETPGPFPVLTQDAGWSAVMDFDLKTQGHYTLQVVRANGGSVILHFDVEVG